MNTAGVLKGLVGQFQEAKAAMRLNQETLDLSSHLEPVRKALADAMTSSATADPGRTGDIAEKLAPAVRELDRLEMQLCSVTNGMKALKAVGSLKRGISDLTVRLGAGSGRRSN